MEIKVENEESRHIDEQTQPLLEENKFVLCAEEQTPIQKAINQTFKSTAQLANLLPTGSVLAFQLLAPIFTNQGQCDVVSQTMTASLLILCGLSCFFLCFTDSFRAQNDKVLYGVATFRGLYIIDGSCCMMPEVAARYRLRFMDFVHAFMSVLVFGAVALFDQNVVKCFYPTPSDEVKELLTNLPVGIGVLCSMMFVAFPTDRHGIGFPLSAK
ncbi:hypothetical protein MKW98_023723 [Papaver atlanticum]|uniref:Uncharacterized protein n=1 Tax=Papaver atlanticum TaxID=357466 RepID=A0AAD4SXI6_9MAGN|nr:hypothetical protein MKW98_023723 [Papaver atlanticum]